MLARFANKNACLTLRTAKLVLVGRTRKDVPLGSRLEGIDGSRVFSVMRIDNKFVPKPVPCYRIKGLGVNGSALV